MKHGSVDLRETRVDRSLRVNEMIGTFGWTAIAALWSLETKEQRNASRPPSRDPAL